MQYAEKQQKSTPLASTTTFGIIQRNDAVDAQPHHTPRSLQLQSIREMAHKGRQTGRTTELQAVMQRGPAFAGTGLAQGQGTIIQRLVTVDGEDYTAGDLIHELWEESQEDEAALVWHDAYRDAVHTFSAEDRVFSDRTRLYMALAGFSMAEPGKTALEKQLRSNSFMANIVGNVSAPSAAHRLEGITQKYAAVSKHVYGWSFAPQATMATDVTTINAYLQAIRDEPDQLPAQPVAWRWNNELDQRVEFTLNGRTYSTHQVPGHPQLYPLRGTNIVHGRGPLDMGRTLLVRGELNERRKVTLYQIYAENTGIEVNQNAYGQLGSRQKQQYAAALDDLL